MPVYDYVCSACGQVTEVIHGITAEGPRFCPACGAEGTLRKGFSTPAVHFKGSGWAKKDRASSATRAASARSGDAKVESDSTGSTDGTAGSTSTVGEDSSSGSSSTSSSKESRASTAEKTAESGGSPKAGRVERGSGGSKRSTDTGNRGGN